MSIEYATSPLPTEGPEGQSGTYVCMFPCISRKDIPIDDVHTAELYEKFPHADYYTKHKSTGTRGIPGQHEVFKPKAPDHLGVINMYVKVYPGNKTYANDNHYKRIKWFGAIFQELSKDNGISVLHLKLPSDIKSEQHEYITHLEDYVSTCKLHGNNVRIYLHGTDGPIEKKVQVKERKAISIKPKGKTPIKLKTTVPAAPSVPSVPSAPAKKEYKLEFNPEQLSNELLYEVDFAQITSMSETGAGSATGRPGVLQYFPDDERWGRIIEDSKLQREAQNVADRLGDALGADNVYPPVEDMFNAFAYLKEDPKVVILGQDPYHKRGQAHGLSFSVKKGVRVPPSLGNIYKALENDPDVNFTRPKHGCLIEWAEQGVVMLNAALSVEEGKPDSHMSVWESFTNRLIELLSTKYEGLIFVLWGGKAKAKSTYIKGNSHSTLEFNHPSPMVRNNTFGTQCRHFSEINRMLQRKNKTPIDWQLTD